MKRQLTFGLITNISGIVWIIISSIMAIATYLKKDEIDAAFQAENSGGSYPFSFHIFNGIFGGFIISLGVFSFLTIIKVLIPFLPSKNTEPFKDEQKEKDRTKRSTE